MIEIIPFTKEHALILGSWFSSKEDFFQWTGNAFNWPMDDAEINKYMAKIDHDDNLLSFSAIEKEAGYLIGHFNIVNIHLNNQRGRISRVIIHPNMRAKGYGKQMLKAAINYSFKILNLHRLELLVFECNKSAIEYYKKSGFLLEGTLRDFVYYENKYWNLSIMSILQEKSK